MEEREREGGLYGVWKGGHGRSVCMVLRRHFLMAYAIWAYYFNGFFKKERIGDGLQSSTIIMVCLSFNLGEFILFGLKNEIECFFGAINLFLLALNNEKVFVVLAITYVLK